MYTRISTDTDQIPGRNEQQIEHEVVGVVEPVDERSTHTVHVRDLTHCDQRKRHDVKGIQP
jgi:hypothetical protein